MKKLIMMLMILGFGFASTAQTRQDTTKKKTEKTRPAKKTGRPRKAQQSVTAFQGIPRVKPILLYKTRPVKTASFYWSFPGIRHKKPALWILYIMTGLPTAGYRA
jgi:hypothetical protein